MPLNIRPLMATDRPEWGRLWQGYLEFYETELPDDIYDVTFARNLDANRTQQRCLVADQNGRLVGLVHYIFHPHNWRAEDVCYLQDLYADPTVRGQGIGRALIQAVYKAADDAGCPSVYWMTQEFNYLGRILYDKVGLKTPFIKYTRP